MITKICYYKIKCDSCGYESEEKFYNSYLNHIQNIRRAGWGVAKDRITCYCPNCKPYYTNCGKMSALVVTPQIEEKRRKRNDIK